MDLSQTAREIIERSLYMVLGTADEAGSPWVSPVYFAVSDYTDFYWVSLPDARHSRNLAGGRRSASPSSTRACRSEPGKAST